mgnify:CR=1 FL=1
MFNFYDHEQIGLSKETICGEDLVTVILSNSDALNITEVSVKNCNTILNNQLKEWEHEYNFYLDTLCSFN